MMYKLIIVDDEQTILNGLKNAIDWNSLGFEIANTYINGEQALNGVLQDPPDAILTDIKMPVKDGISFIRDVRKAGFNNIKVVYLSGYDDFQYAQASTRLGAVDYILKPSNPKDIISVFTNIRKGLDHEKKLQQAHHNNQKIMSSSLSLIRAQLFCDMVKGDLSNYQDFLQQYFKYLPGKSRNVFFVVSFTADYLVSQKLTNCDFAQDKQIMEQTLISVMHPYMQKGDIFDPYIHFVKNAWTFTLIFSGIQLDIADKLIQEYYTRLNERNISIEFGVGTFVDDIGKVNSAYAQSLCRLFKVPECRKDTLMHLLTSDKLPKTLFERDGDHLRGYLWECIASIQEASPNEKQLYGIFVYCICLCIYNMTTPEVAGEFFDRISSLDIVPKSSTEIVLLLKQIFDGVSGTEKRNYQLCCEIVQLIDKKYMENITLNFLSKKFYVSPNYLSALFRKYMGTSIHQYVTNVRLEAADRLIRNRKCKLYEIADQVGYSNYEYFRKIYFRNRGKNPSEIT